MTIAGLTIARATVGLTQGVVLYLLHRADDAKTWPATDGLIFAPLLVAAIFVPTIVVAGLGNLRPRTLAVWAVAATAICAGLGYYAVFSDPVETGGVIRRLAPNHSLDEPRRKAVHPQRIDRGRRR